MAKIKKVTHGRHEGKIVIKKGIVDGIVFLAVSELPYVSFNSTKPYDKSSGYEDIKITHLSNSLIVDVTVNVHYSQSVSDIAFKIQEAIRHNVEIMTEYHVAAVNVYVKGVTFDDVVETKKPKKKINPFKKEDAIKTEEKADSVKPTEDKSEAK